MSQKRSRSANKHGFSLIELMVTMCVSGIVGGLIFSAYQCQQKFYINQEQIAMMQQDLRVAMYYMQREIRMAGFDTSTNRDANAGIQVAGPDSISFTLDIAGGDEDGVDNDGDGLIDEGSDNADNDSDGLTDELDEGEYDSDTDDANEDISYFLGDIDGDGDNDLGRRDNTLPTPTDPEEELVAENIQAIGFAYAFDSDRDGDLDTYSVSGEEVVIWAIDSDADSDLDKHLDTNVDGNIDTLDDADGDGDIEGTGLSADVDLADIRAVRIWMLARSPREDTKFENTNTYVIGNQVIEPETDTTHRRMRLAETIVKCRNAEL